MSCAVILSVYMGLGGCLCPISPSAWRDGMDYLHSMKNTTSSASAADDMTDLMVLEIVNTAPLLGGNVVFLDINKCPPDLLPTFGLER